MSEAGDLSDVTVLALTGSLQPTGGAEKAFRAIVAGFRERLGMTVLLAAHIPSDHPSVPKDLTLLRPDGARPGPGMLLRARAFAGSARRPAILFGFQINSNVVCALARASLPPARRLPMVLNDRAAVDVMVSPRPGGGRGGRVGSLVMARAARFAYRSADQIVCNSRANAERMRAFLGGRTPPIDTIYNPLDAEALLARFPERPRDGFAEPDAPLIVSHGRLHPQKGYDTLIRAFARVRDRHPRARLRIHGEGEERPALEALAAALDVSGAVELPGFADDPAAAIEGGDVYVLSSRYEGLPNSLLEAIGVGLPAIAADCPTGPDEILGRDESAGLLYPVDDVDALAERLETLLADGARRAALGRAARRRAADFSLAANVDAYAVIFRRLLGR